jgi:hypothetical protein
VLLQRHADPLAGSPDNAACSLRLFALNKEGEPVRNEQRGHDLESRTAFREIANGAFNCGASTLNQASFQYSAPRGPAGFMQHQLLPY